MDHMVGALGRRVATVSELTLLLSRYVQAMGGSQLLLKHYGTDVEEDGQHEGIKFIENNSQTIDLIDVLCQWILPFEDDTSWSLEERIQYIAKVADESIPALHDEPAPGAHVESFLMSICCIGTMLPREFYQSLQIPQKTKCELLALYNEHRKKDTSTTGLSTWLKSSQKGNIEVMQKLVTAVRNVLVRSRSGYSNVQSANLAAGVRCALNEPKKRAIQHNDPNSVMAQKPENWPCGPEDGFDTKTLVICHEENGQCDAPLQPLPFPDIPSATQQTRKEDQQGIEQGAFKEETSNLTEKTNQAQVTRRIRRGAIPYYYNGQVHVWYPSPDIEIPTVRALKREVNKQFHVPRTDLFVLKVRRARGTVSGILQDTQVLPLPDSVAAVEKRMAEGRVTNLEAACDSSVLFVRNAAEQIQIQMHHVASGLTTRKILQMTVLLTATILQIKHEATRTLNIPLSHIAVRLLLHDGTLSQPLADRHTVLQYNVLNGQNWIAYDESDGGALATEMTQEDACSQVAGTVVNIHSPGVRKSSSIRAQHSNGRRTSSSARVFRP